MTYTIKSVMGSEKVTGQLIDALNAAEKAEASYSIKGGVTITDANGTVWYDSGDPRTMDELLDDIY